MHVWVGTLKGQKKAFDPLELELQVVDFASCSFVGGGAESRMFS